MATGESEFGGAGGMVPPQSVGRETLQQQVWEVYATNVGGRADDPTTTIEAAPERVGFPLESSS